MGRLKQRASLIKEDDMKRTLRMNALLASLFAGLVILSPVQAAQQGRAEAPKAGRPEAPRIIRKANNALQASAINRVDAVYPPQAIPARIFGTVSVEVAIDESGNVTSARALSGHPLLRDAAVDAARGWTFKPTILQGNPVKVLGMLTFTFNLPDYVLRDRNIERLKRQLALTPENPKLYYQIGRAYEDNQQDGDALKAYARAVALNPDYGEALAALGSLNMKLNHYDEALIASKRAVLLNLTPEVKAAAYRAIALIYFRRDQFQEAVEPFKQAIALAPQGSLYLNLGLTYLKLGDKTSALEQHRLLKERNSILAEQLLDRINEAK
jgi:TonB family protein